MKLLMDPRFLQAQGLIHNIQSSAKLESDLRAMSIQLARLILQMSRKHSSWKEIFQFNQLAAMMDDPVGKHFTCCLMDRLFRTKSAKYKGKLLHDLMRNLGAPRYLQGFMKAALGLVDRLYVHFPKMASSLIGRLIKMQVSDIIISSEGRHLQKHLQKRKNENIRINLNHLGEAILGEKEAKARLELYLSDLQDPNVEYISIKISTLFSQIQLLDYQGSLEKLKKALSQLYAESLKNTYESDKGEKRVKFVNLDMEEYKDLELTLDLFEQTLSEEAFLQVRAGIVLQSYLPDSFQALKRLIAFGKKRQDRGGEPIKIRLVKGANLAMETFESKMRGWKLATYDSKAEVDANFKKILQLALEAVKEKTIILGVGSHNLFDVCYALLIREFYGLKSGVELEMLEGMAPQVRKIVHALSGDMLLYCPVATDREFHSALAYLVRRLDENTGPDNFLRHFFHLDGSQEAFDSQSERFLRSFEQMEEIASAPLRTQNRKSEEDVPFIRSCHLPFQNEPDTDWSLSHHLEWIQTHLKKAQLAGAPLVPIEMASASSFVYEQVDPSDPSKLAFRVPLVDVEGLERAMQIGLEATSSWAQKSVDERADLLHKVASKIRQKRGVLIAAMLKSCGKTVQEADAEVSEAIDFVEYNVRHCLQINDLEGFKVESRGLVAVIPPWNFPLALAANGLIASLITGHPVIFKPSLEASFVGYLLAQIFWEVSVPSNVLQLLVCEEETVGNRLVEDPRLGAIVLTGSTLTAEHFIKKYPRRHLLAETGGKNAMILMPSCDRDQAIRDLLQSSFSHSGQKCSSCSLALVHREIYEDPHFWQQLLDASESLTVGSSWNMATKVGPLIVPPSGKLLLALTELDKGEAWVLKPKVDLENPRLWSVGIVKDVKARSRRHLEEFFGPVLGVMPIDSLEEAIERVNETSYGLTSGLQSLDDEEHAFWQARILAGNLYINRPTTGAMVARQPFGGTKASRRGHGFKAGGPHMLLGLYRPIATQAGDLQMKCPEKLWAFLNLVKDEEKPDLGACFRSYSYWYHHLSTPMQEVRLSGQENLQLHVPAEKILLRWSQGSSLIEQLQTLAASLLCHETIEVSVFSTPSEKLIKLVGDRVKWHVESELELIKRMQEPLFFSIRWLGECEESIWQWAAEKGVNLWIDPPIYHGRVELLYYLREVSVSRDYHRYGNLGLEKS